MLWKIWKLKRVMMFFLKSTSTAICGFELHILNGFIPQTKPIIMGYEFVGIVEEIKNTVTHLKVGDCIVVPSPIASGHVLPLTNTSRECDKFKIKKRIA